MNNQVDIPESMKDVLSVTLPLAEKSITVCYKPRRSLNKLLEWLEKIKFSKVDAFTLDDALAVRNNPDLLSEVVPFPAEEATKKYSDFIQVCLLYRDPELLQEVVRNAPTKTDGTLFIGRVQRLAYTGVSVKGKFFELCAVNSSEDFISMSIRRQVCSKRGASLYEQIPSCEDTIKKWNHINQRNLDEGFVPLKSYLPAPYGPSKNMALGDTFTFGKKKIQWKVIALKADRALVISENVPFQRPFLETFSPSSNWKESDLRAWLNGEFLQQGFFEEERDRILLTKNVNPGNAKKGLSGGEDTEDRIFILSEKEASDLLVPLNALDAGTYWWLRTVGQSGQHFSFCSSGSKIWLHRNGGVWYDRGVRPAMWISLPSQQRQVPVSNKDKKTIQSQRHSSDKGESDTLGEKKKKVPHTGAAGLELSSIQETAEEYVVTDDDRMQSAEKKAIYDDYVRMDQAHFHQSIEERCDRIKQALLRDNIHHTYLQSVLFLLLTTFQIKSRLEEKRLSPYGNDYGIMAAFEEEQISTYFSEFLTFLVNDLRLAYQIALARSIPLEDRFEASTYQVFRLEDLIPSQLAQEYALRLTNLFYTEEELTLIPGLFEKAITRIIEPKKKYAALYPMLQSFKSTKPLLELSRKSEMPSDLQNALYFKVEDNRYDSAVFTSGEYDSPIFTVDSGWVYFWDAYYVQIETLATRNTKKKLEHIRGEKASIQKFRSTVSSIVHLQYAINPTYPYFILSKKNDRDSFPLANQPEDIWFDHYTLLNYDHLLSWEGFTASIHRFAELNSRRFSLMEEDPRLNSLEKAAPMLGIAFLDKAEAKDPLGLGFNLNDTYITIGFQLDENDAGSFEPLDIGWLFLWKCTAFDVLSKSKKVFECRRNSRITEEIFIDYTTSIYAFISKKVDFWNSFEEHAMKRIEKNDYQWEGWEPLNQYLTEAPDLLKEKLLQERIIHENKGWFGEERRMRSAAKKEVNLIEQKLASLLG